MGDLIALRPVHGLTDTEADVLEALAFATWQDVVTIAEATGLEQAETWKALRALRRMGLALGVAGMWRRTRRTRQTKPTIKR